MNINTTTKALESGSTLTRTDYELNGWTLSHIVYSDGFKRMGISNSGRLLDINLEDEGFRTLDADEDRVSVSWPSIGNVDLDHAAEFAVEAALAVETAREFDRLVRELNA